MPRCTFCLDEIPTGTMMAWCVEHVPTTTSPGTPAVTTPAHYNVPNAPYHRDCARQMVRTGARGAGGNNVIGYQMGFTVTNGSGLILRG